jgi:phage baseplate assembly protein W
MATTFTDIDISFERHPGTHDIFRLRDDVAVRQSIKNILMSNAFDKPFDPDFDMNLNGLLFENLHPGLKVMLKKKVEEILFRYEHRIIVDDVIITQEDDYNSLVVTVMYFIVGVEQAQTITVTVERTR